MDHETLTTRIHEAAALADAGSYERAREDFIELASSPGLADRDQSILLINAAICSGKLDEPNTALAWYDRAIECEARARFSLALESRAAYLYEIGDAAGCRAAYEKLLASGILDEEGRARARTNLAQLGG